MESLAVQFLIPTPLYLCYCLVQTVLLVSLSATLAVVQMTVSHPRMFVELREFFLNPTPSTRLRAQLKGYP
jgi:hypothetical protein